VETTTLDRNGNERASGSGFNEPDVRRAEQGHVTLDVRTLGWSDCGCPCDCYPYHDPQTNNCAKYRRGVVLDCFGGSGTTGAAAVEQGRDAILIDLDERNVELARERIGLFLNVETNEQPMPGGHVSAQTHGGVPANG
jgi:hypothetical protein